MSFEDCIDEKLKKAEKKRQNKEYRRLEIKGEKMKRLYNKFKTHYKNKGEYDDATIETMAAADAIRIIREQQEYDAMIKKRSVLDYEKYLKTVEEKGNGSHSKAVRWLAENSIGRSQAIHRRTLLTIGDYVEKNRAKFAGLKKDYKNSRLVIKELAGESTNDATAAEYAKALRSVMDNLRQRFINAGGIINDLDNYFPQRHSRVLLKKVPLKEWKEKIIPLLDIKKTKDFETGLPVDEIKLNEILDDTYLTVTTGVSRQERLAADNGDAAFKLGGDVNTRHQHSRVLHFKDANSFLKYNDEFGSDAKNLYDMMLGSLESMARDIALLETYGVRPHNLMRKAELQMKVQNGLNQVKTAQALATYKIASGQHLQENSNHWAFTRIADIQALIRSAYLGGAVISSITDLPISYIASRHTGINPLKAFDRYFKNINPLSKRERRAVKQLGFIADIASASALSQTRFETDSLASGLPQALSNFTIVASGLRAHTNAIKNSASMEWESTLAEYSIRKTAWDKLPNNIRQTLADNDITADDWVLIKKAPLFEIEGGKFLNSIALDLMETDKPLYVRELGTKLDTVTELIRQMAASEATVDVLTITTGGAAPQGTIIRSAVSSLLTFKTFPLTIMQRQLRPLFKFKNNNLRVNKAEHFAAYIVVGALFGAIAIDAKQFLLGNTPPDKDNPRFWLQALMQSGGFSLMGDFLFHDTSRFGNSPLETFAGPIYTLSFDFAQALKGNLDRAINNGDYKDISNTGRDLYKFFVDRLPAKNLWYSKLFLDRKIFNKFEEWLDDDFHTRVMQANRRLEKQGQRQWWEKGDETPKF